MANSLDIALKNTTDGTVYAYIHGDAIHNDGALCFIQADGRTPYFPQSPPENLSPLGADCAIRLGPPGTTITATIPQLASAQVWFSVNTPLVFLLNKGPRLVAPSVSNPSDPNINTSWGFCELTLDQKQLYANISYVDFVSIPISLSLTNASGVTRVVKGIPKDGLDIICNALVAQNATDGAGWDKLVVKAPTGGNLRALSPNLGIVVNPSLFSGYFEPDVDLVWNALTSHPLTVDTQSSFGTVQGTVSGGHLTFPGLGSYSKPSTRDIFACNSGPFVTDSAAMAALTPRVSAAFNRSTLHNQFNEPADPATYYQSPKTNHYSRIVHATNMDRLGYAFPYDDVEPTNGVDQSGSVADPNPSLLTIVVGGGPSDTIRDATSQIRAETFDSSHGVQTEPCLDSTGGRDVGWISNGDWIAFNLVDFQSEGMTKFTARVASGALSGVSGQVQVRLDSPTANPVGNFSIANTGGWQSWATVTTDISTVTGTHKLFLTFASGQPEDFVNINWFTFSRHGPPSNTGRKYKTVLYFPNYVIYQRAFNPQALPADQVTHINYAFADVKSDGEVISSDTFADFEKHFPSDSWNDVGTNVYGCIKQLFLLKKRNRHLKVVLSIGGWGFRTHFAGPVSTPQGRAEFAQSAVTLVKDLGLDGIDIDWEYPADDGQGRNFVDLLREIRAGLDAYSSQFAGGYRFLLTVASSVGPSNYQFLHMKEMDQYLDFWNLMAYDMAGGWDTIAGHQANIYKSSSNPSSTPFSADEAVRYYTTVGQIDPAKICLGMPVYGHAFTNTDGPGKPFSGVGPGSWDAGVWDYKALPQPGATEHYDPDLIASWSYDPAQRTMVTYDTPEAETHKSDYIKDKGLGGAMWWECSGDKQGHQSLVWTVANALGTSNYSALDQTNNLLDYPQSKYDNLRNQFPGS